MTIDNPAHRLWLLLTDARYIKSDVKCKMAWASLLGVEVNSPDLYGRLGKFMQLPHDAIEALKVEHSDELPAAQHWFTQISVAFERQHLHETWQTFISHIDGHSMNYLKVHAKLINGGKQLKVLELDTLAQARADLATLLNTVLGDDTLDIGVRQALVRNLRGLLSSIEEYKLTGSAAVFDSISVVYGQGFFDSKYREAVSQSSPIGSKLHSIVGGLADAMTVILGVAPIADLTKKMLLLSQT
ncbi:hypothetical protein A7J67_18425 [Achromobacter xylosoxidans]|nr:hypothetical protein A7J67_18425 [Achromobacter xylosoxidans]